MSTSPYLACALLLTVSLLQTTAMPLLSLWGVMPDLVLLVVVSWSLLRGAGEGIIWALGGGLMLDLLSGGAMGLATIPLALSSVVINTSLVNIPRDSFWLPMVAGILATAAYDLAQLTFLRISGHRMPWAPSFLRVVVPSIALNALAVYPVFWAIGWLHRRTSTQKIQW